MNGVSPRQNIPVRIFMSLAEKSPSTLVLVLLFNSPYHSLLLLKQVCGCLGVVGKKQPDRSIASRRLTPKIDLTRYLTPRQRDESVSSKQVDALLLDVIKGRVRAEHGWLLTRCGDLSCPGSP